LYARRSGETTCVWFGVGRWVCWFAYLLAAGQLGKTTWYNSSLRLQKEEEKIVFLKLKLKSHLRFEKVLNFVGRQKYNFLNMNNIKA
jgi:hypothetical protein